MGYKEFKNKLIENRIFKDSLSIWEIILDWLWYNNFSCFLRHFIRFLKRLPKWVKVAWEQEDWDFEYLYDLIELKLKEFLKAQEEDTIHHPLCTKKCIKQIKVTLARLDRYRNWPNYYEYPMEDVHSEPSPDHDGYYILVHDSEENEKQRLGAIDFEQHNYDKFWKDFLQWHQNWWT